MTRSELYTCIKEELETTRPVASVIMMYVDEYTESSAERCNKNSCAYPEPHRHGFACNTTCGVCYGR